MTNLPDDLEAPLYPARRVIREAMCGACGETFVPADDHDLDHVVCADGLACGGHGTIVATYAQREAADAASAARNRALYANPDAHAVWRQPAEWGKP